MLVTLHDQLGRPHRLRATSIVIYDEVHGNPLVVLLEHTPGGYIISKYDDADFNTVLQQMGVRKTVICTDAQPPRDLSV